MPLENGEFDVYLLIWLYEKPSWILTSSQITSCFVHMFVMAFGLGHFDLDPIESSYTYMEVPGNSLLILVAS